MRNKKTSTAALGSVREWLDFGSRRVPCHPSGARRVLPMILRVAFSLILWTLGSGMPIVAAPGAGFAAPDVTREAVD